MIIIGSYQMLLNKGVERLQMESEGLDKQGSNKEFFKVTMKKLLAQGIEVVEDLEATVTRLGPEKWCLLSRKENQS